MATYVKRVLIGIDKLGNAIAGGNEECTISGRTGYHAENTTGPMLYYWLFLQLIIDITFYPWDGMGHCKQAYEKETDKFLELKSFRGLALFVLSLFTLVSCAIMAPVFWIIYGIKTLIKKIAMS